MEELEFSNRFLGDYVIRGDEIIPEFCPFCHGGEHRDRRTFALNKRKHVFVCHRGSCNRSGHFDELLRLFDIPIVKREGETMNGSSTHSSNEHRSTGRMSGKLMTMPRLVNSAEETNYLHSRGISDDTARAFAVGGDGSGKLLFPFFETKEQFVNKTPVAIKYRYARQIIEGQNKMWREPGTASSLFGMHLCDPKNDTLYVFEGEFDCLSGYQLLHDNCVSVPNGSTDLNWVADYRDFLSQFSKVVIFGDNDVPGRAMVEKLIKELDCQVLIPDFELYAGCKDANEILVKYGEERLRFVLSAVQIAPIPGLRDVSAVNMAEDENKLHVSTGMPTLDKILGGGLTFANLFVWAGKSGEGKSTLVSMLALESINQGYPVCVYSGELSDAEFKQTLCLQAAGSNHVLVTENQATKNFERSLPADVQDKIDLWLRGKIVVLDRRAAEVDNSDNLFRLFRMAHKQYGCRVFILDNLMTVKTNGSDSDQYLSQGKFVLELKNFALKYNAIIHLVLHARKSGEERVKYLGDISGSAIVTNAASAVCAVGRTQDTKTKVETSFISCLKNRMEGSLRSVKMKFIPKSRQLIEAGCEERQYRWEDIDTAENR